MADRWWNCPLGADMANDAVEGASDTAQFVAVRVTYDATGNSKLAAYKAVMAAANAILEDTWPPV